MPGPLLSSKNAAEAGNRQLAVEGKKCVVLYFNPCIHLRIIVHGYFVTYFVLSVYDFVNERGIYGTI